MVTYYAVVEGDPLDSGSGGEVRTGSDSCWIEGPDGKQRRMAYVGHTAWCGKCESTGYIAKGVPVRAGDRMLDLTSGAREQAVGGDFVICKCPDHPRIIATYGRTWMIHDNGDWTGVSSKASAVPKSVDQPDYDQYFLLKDERTGRPLADFLYEITTEDDQKIEGRTDQLGRTQRILSENATIATIHIFDDHAPLDPDWDQYP